MSPSERFGALLEVLTEFFSAPIARLFLTITMQRLELGSTPELSAEALPGLVRALTEALPSYMSDPRRRELCIARMATLAPESVERHGAPLELPRVASIESARSTLRSRESKRPSLRPTKLPVRSAEDVVAVCDAVRALTRQVGFPALLQTKIATAVAELARNLQLYAREGEVCLTSIGVPPRGVEVVTTDAGPGIPNLDVVMGGTYRSRTGMGMGLRGARKLMDTFDISTSPSGTRVTVRKYLT